MGMAGKGTPATRVLEQARVEHRLHSYVHDPDAAYGIEAAESLGLDPGRVFKTLLAMLDGRPAVAVVPVSRQLDLKALAASLGAKKATMAAPGDAERLTGYVLGGISPLGHKRRLPTVIDASARIHDAIFVSAGRRGLEVELAPDDLARLTGATFAGIAAAGG